MSGRRPPRGVVRIPPKGVVTRTSTDMRSVSDLHVAIALRCLSDRSRDAQLSVADVWRAISRWPQSPPHPASAGRPNSTGRSAARWAPAPGDTAPGNDRRPHRPEP
jgi:hypothetical protein